MENEIAWLLGIITGDGHINKYYIVISDKYYENLKVVKSVIKKLGYKSKITRDKYEDRYRLWINSKKFVLYIKPLGLSASGQLPVYILSKKYNHALVRSFLKGLYDAEGYVEYWKPRRRLRVVLTNKSEQLIRFSYNYLKLNGLKPYLRYSSRAFRIQIYRKRDLFWFISNIGFNYPSKIKKLNEYYQLLPTALRSRRKAET